MSERTTVRLPPELVKRAKQKAAADGRTLTALIEDGLRHVLDERGMERARVPVPVSNRSGKLMPGIDLNDSAALQEIEDLARFGVKP